MKLRDAKQQLADANKQAAEALRIIDEHKRRSIIKCVKCKRGTRVSKLTLIQTTYYVRPYSCTGGDYWAYGDRAFDCPKCGRRNHEGDDDWENPQITKLAKYFKKKVVEHEKDV